MSRIERLSGRRDALVFVLVTILLLVTAAGLSAQRKKRSTPGDPRVGAPLAVEEVIQFAGRVPKSALGIRTLSDIVRSRKLSFQATDENVKQLRDGGVPDEVIEIVREVSPPPAPPPPPPKPATGVLSINCAPKECNVQIDHGALEPTQGGVLRKEVAIGTRTIDFSRAGFESKRQEITVPAEGTRVDVLLVPDQATRRVYGNAIFQRMVQALGDENADIAGKGAFIVQRGGVPDEWTFALRMGPGQSTLALRKASGPGIELLCQGETCDAKKPNLLGGKQMKGNDASDLETKLNVFRRYNVAWIVASMRRRFANGLFANAGSDLPGPDGNYHLTVEGTAERFELVLNAQFLPIQMAYRSKLEAANAPAPQATYTDYVNLGKVRYPKMTQIKTPDPRVGLLQIRLDLAPTLGGRT